MPRRRWRSRVSRLLRGWAERLEPAPGDAVATGFDLSAAPPVWAERVRTAAAARGGLVVTGTGPRADDPQPAEAARDVPLAEFPVGDAPTRPAPRLPARPGLRRHVLGAAPPATAERATQSPSRRAVPEEATQSPSRRAAAHTRLRDARSAGSSAIVQQTVPEEATQSPSRRVAAHPGLRDARSAGSSAIVQQAVPEEATQSPSRRAAPHTGLRDARSAGSSAIVQQAVPEEVAQRPSRRAAPPRLRDARSAGSSAIVPGDARSAGSSATIPGDARSAGSSATVNANANAGSADSSAIVDTLPSPAIPADALWPELPTRPSVAALPQPPVELTLARLTRLAAEQAAT